MTRAHARTHLAQQQLGMAPVEQAHGVVPGRRAVHLGWSAAHDSSSSGATQIGVAEWSQGELASKQLVHDGAAREGSEALQVQRFAHNEHIYISYQGPWRR